MTDLVDGVAKRAIVAEGDHLFAALHSHRRPASTLRLERDVVAVEVGVCRGEPNEPDSSVLLPVLDGFGHAALLGKRGGDGVGNLPLWPAVPLADDDTSHRAELGLRRVPLLRVALHLLDGSEADVPFDDRIAIDRVVLHLLVLEFPRGDDARRRARRRTVFTLAGVLVRRLFLRRGLLGCGLLRRGLFRGLLLLRWHHGLQSLTRWRATFSPRSCPSSRTTARSR